MKNVACVFMMLLLLCSTGCQTTEDNVVEANEGSLEIEGSGN